MSTYTSSDKVISSYRNDNMYTSASETFNDFIVGESYEIYSTKTNVSLTSIYANTAKYQVEEDGSYVLDDDGNKILTNIPQSNVYALCSYADLETETWRFYINSDENYYIEITSDDSSILTRSIESNTITKYRQLTVDSTNNYVLNSDKIYSWENPDEHDDEDEDDEDEEESIISLYRNQLETTEFDISTETSTLKTDIYYYIYSLDSSQKLDSIFAYSKSKSNSQITFYLNNDSAWSIIKDDPNESLIRELHILDKDTIAESAKMIIIDDVNNYVIYSDKFEKVVTDIDN